MISINENNFPHNLLLTDRQVKSLHKAFANNSSKDTKLLETHISKTIQSTEFFGRLLGPLLKVSLPLMKNLLQSLAKILLIPLGLTAAASAINAGIQKKILVSETTTLLVSNKGMKDMLDHMLSYHLAQ